MVLMLQQCCIMNVAIPRLNEFIAPCFEAAKCFEIISIKNGKLASTKTINCSASEGFFRIRLLQLHHVNTLICNGIKNFYRDHLLSLGISVIPNVNYSIGEAINLFLDGKLISSENSNFEVAECGSASHEDLVSWAKEIFEGNGYLVSSCFEDESFLIDLIARMKCPVCGKQIQVAICCGAQTYRADQEIREFHHSTKTQFDARVYVNLTNPKLAKSCSEYGIDFLSPETVESYLTNNSNSLIPVLQRPVEGHEKAFNIEA